MKAFFKIFFIFLFGIFTALNNLLAVEAFSSFIIPETNLEIVSHDYKETKQSYITNISTKDYAIAPANCHQELYAPSDKKDDLSFWNGEFLYSQNRISQFIRSAVLFRSRNGTFYNLSSYLKNEICVRAP